MLRPLILREPDEATDSPCGCSGLEIVEINTFPSFDSSVSRAIRVRRRETRARRRATADRSEVGDCDDVERIINSRLSSARRREFKLDIVRDRVRSAHCTEQNTFDCEIAGGIEVELSGCGDGRVKISGFHRRY